MPAKDIESTKVIDHAAPMAVQLDGKEVIAAAYIEDVEAGGTQKAHGQVVFQWIDPDDGKVLSTVTIDLTPVVGAGVTGGALQSQAYDTATGQVAISLGIKSNGTAPKYSYVTAYADPKTKKAVAMPDVRVAGVLDGTFVGAKGVGSESAKDLSIAVVDGSTGAIKKNLPAPTMHCLSAQGTGGKRAYLSGSGYVEDTKYDGHYISTIYAVDIASGAVVETKMPNSEHDDGYTCQSDHVVGLVCNHVTGGNDIDEILAFDDTTGKKIWGYSSKSANRVVPRITTLYNGYVYGQAQTLPAVLDAKTGQDVPVPTPTPGTSVTPTDGITPTPGGTPSDDGGPTGGFTTPSTGAGDPGLWGDTSLIYGEPKSPEAVSKYGSTYLQSAGDKAPSNTENILVVQKATS